MTTIPAPASSDTDARRPARSARAAGVGATVSVVAARTLRKYMHTPQLLVSTVVGGAIVRVDTLPGWMQPVAEHQPITIMCNAVRSLALGDPALAGLGHSATYWALLSLAWAAGITLVFAPLAAAIYRRSS